MTTVDLDRALRSAGLVAPVRWDEVTGSTNATAARLAREGAPEWTLVGAGHQDAGRGRHGRTWQDHPGGAVITSVLLRPTGIDPQAAGLLPLLAGVAWAEAIDDAGAPTVRCKWPNDLLSDGGKVGGILAESVLEQGRLAWVVIGSGINLVAPDDVRGAAGVGGDVDPTRLLGGFLRAFSRVYRPDSTTFADEVIERWTERSATLGKHVTAAGHDVEGLAVALDRHGGLIVELEDGRRVTVTSEDVTHLR